jgi:hypothetical protein
MRCKLFVALQLEVAHHFVERCASGRIRGFEPPATFGTPKTPKTLLFNPHQFPAHGCPYCCAPTLSDRMPSARLLSGDETFWFAITTPLAAAYRLIAVENRHPVWAWQKMREERAILHAPIWMVCSASYIHGRFWFVRSPDFGACFEEAESL